MVMSNHFEKIGEDVDVLRCPNNCGFDYVTIKDIAKFAHPFGVLIFGVCGHCQSDGVWKLYCDKGKAEMVLLKCEPA